METSPGADAVLERFRSKAIMAGGPRPGYMLRRTALEVVGGSNDLDAAIDELVAGGFLKLNEGGNLVYLTAAGAERLGP